LPNLDTKKLNSIVAKENTDIVSRFLPGVDLPYVQSNFRQQIIGMATKIFRIFSKMQTFKTQKTIDRQVYELLMDPDGMRKFMNATAGMKFGIKPTDYRKLLGAMREIFPVYLYGGFKSSVGSEETQNTPISTRIQ